MGNGLIASFLMGDDLTGIFLMVITLMGNCGWRMP